jgi:hypothetical protein
MYMFLSYYPVKISFFCKFFTTPFPPPAPLQRGIKGMDGGLGCGFATPGYLLPNPAKRGILMLFSKSHIVTDF